MKLQIFILLFVLVSVSSFATLTEITYSIDSITHSARGLNFANNASIEFELEADQIYVEVINSSQTILTSIPMENTINFQTAGSIYFESESISEYSVRLRMIPDTKSGNSIYTGNCELVGGNDQHPYIITQRVYNSSSDNWQDVGCMGDTGLDELFITPNCGDDFCIDLG